MSLSFPGKAQYQTQTAREVSYAAMQDIHAHVTIDPLQIDRMNEGARCRWCPIKRRTAEE
jgi:hypothetical protein